MTDDKWFISGLHSVDPIISYPSRLSASERFFGRQNHQMLSHIEHHHSDEAWGIARHTENQFYCKIITDKYCCTGFRSG